MDMYEAIEELKKDQETERKKIEKAQKDYNAIAIELDRFQRRHSRPYSRAVVHDLGIIQNKLSEAEGRMMTGYQNLKRLTERIEFATRHLP